jgi:hypothetical protein
MGSNIRAPLLYIGTLSMIIMQLTIFSTLAGNGLRRLTYVRGGRKWVVLFGRRYCTLEPYP